MPNSPNLLQSLLSNGGPVVYVLLIFLGVVTLIFLERLLFMHRHKSDTAELLRGLINHLKAGNVKDALANCTDRSGLAAKLFRDAISRWKDGEQQVRAAVDNSICDIIHTLEDNMRLLSCLGNAAPVLGLLGTFFWIMDILEITQASRGQLMGTSVITLQVRNALTCTAIGLIVSLAAHLFYFYLASRIEKFVHDLNKGGAEITYFLGTNPYPGDTDSSKG